MGGRSSSGDLRAWLVISLLYNIHYIYVYTYIGDLTFGIGRELSLILKEIKVGSLYLRSSCFHISLAQTQTQGDQGELLFWRRSRSWLIFLTQTFSDSGGDQDGVNNFNSHFHKGGSLKSCALLNIEKAETATLVAEDNIFHSTWPNFHSQMMIDLTEDLIFPRFLLSTDRVLAFLSQDFFSIDFTWSYRGFAKILILIDLSTFSATDPNWSYEGFYAQQIPIDLTKVMPRCWLPTDLNWPYQVLELPRSWVSFSTDFNWPYKGDHWQDQRRRGIGCCRGGLEICSNGNFFYFYRPQVNLGSDLWVRMSLTHLFET